LKVQLSDLVPRRLDATPLYSVILLPSLFTTPSLLYHTVSCTTQSLFYCPASLVPHSLFFTTQSLSLLTIQSFYYPFSLLPSLFFTTQSLSLPSLSFTTHSLVPPCRWYYPVSFTTQSLYYPVSFITQSLYYPVSFTTKITAPGSPRLSRGLYYTPKTRTPLSPFRHTPATGFRQGCRQGCRHVV